MEYEQTLNRLDKIRNSLEHLIEVNQKLREKRSKIEKPFLDKISELESNMLIMKSQAEARERVLISFTANKFEEIEEASKSKEQV